MEQDPHSNDKKKLLDARLSDLEKESLKRFCQDEQLVHAVEKVLLYSLYQMGIVEGEDRELHDVNWVFSGDATMSDEEVGRITRIRANALFFMKDAFTQIKKYGVTVADVYEEANPAR